MNSRSAPASSFLSMTATSSFLGRPRARRRVTTSRFSLACASSPGASLTYLQGAARFLEGKPRAARKQVFVGAVADVAEEVRPPSRPGEELVINGSSVET